ncbi:MAG TPA: hypothetical protein VL175_11765 [Pirellulales bacterium]|jgi:hypothetical protein|nr:hypothetical protein [Pirellulales bacterium]
MQLLKGMARLSLLLALLPASGCGLTSIADSSGSNQTPGEVISKFLEAIRAGDDEQASGLLTPLARQKTAEMQMVVAPPGSETARFQVLDTQLQSGAAHVTSDWTDLDSDGKPHTDRIVWILHHEPQGWRIAGMSARVFADQEPIVLNFEDPADMLRKQQQAEEEIARRDGRSPAASASDAPAIR